MLPLFTVIAFCYVASIPSPKVLLNCLGRQPFSLSDTVLSGIFIIANARLISYMPISVGHANEFLVQDYVSEHAET